MEVPVMDLVALDGVPAFAEGSSAFPAELLGLTLFLLPLGQDLGVFSSGLTVLLGTSSLESDTMTLALENDRGDEALDLRSPVLGLLTLLHGQGSLDDILANVIFLTQVKKLPDLRSSLRSKSAWNCAVSQARDFSITLLDDGHRQDGKVSVDNTATNRLSLALASAALTVAGVTFSKQKTDTALS